MAPRARPSGPPPPKPPPPPPAISAVLVPVVIVLVIVLVVVLVMVLVLVVEARCNACRLDSVSEDNRRGAPKPPSEITSSGISPRRVNQADWMLDRHPTKDNDDDDDEEEDVDFFAPLLSDFFVSFSCSLALNNVIPVPPNTHALR